MSSNPSSGVSAIKSNLKDLTQQIRTLQKQLVEEALNNLLNKEAERDGGSADIEFVKTIPSKGLNCKKGTSIQILHPFHVDFPEGCVTVLMGPSGAGKTTLLDFVTGTIGRSLLALGEVHLPINDAYVPQDDRLHSFYTCQTYMEHYARLSGMKPLCCGSSSGRGNQKGKSSGDVEDGDNDQDMDVDEHIASVLEGVGLTKQKNTIVGGLFQRGLSGGQKRRLSVALEVLSNPLNLFLDEPTSGLDSESALGLMEYLKEYASSKCPETGRRRRVILTIHQPSSFIWELVDNVILLAEGRLMYQGSRVAMEAFFTSVGHPTPMNYNPADHYIRAIFQAPKLVDYDASAVDSKVDDDEETISQSEAHKQWSQRFEEWHANTAQSEPPPKKKLKKGGKSNSRVSMVLRDDPGPTAMTINEHWENVQAHTYAWTTIAIELTRRYFVNLAKNPGILGLRIIIYILLSLVVGLLFFDIGEGDSMRTVLATEPALLYFIVAFFSSMAVAVVPFALLEKGIVEKEVRNGRYHPAFFHAAQAIASVPGVFILAVLTTLIIMYMTKLDGSVPIFLTIIFLCLCCAEAMAQLTAHVVTAFVPALAALSGIIGIFTLFMGFIIVPSEFPRWLSWAYYVPFMTYSLRSLMVNEFKNQTYNVPNPITQCIIGAMGNNSNAKAFLVNDFPNVTDQVSGLVDNFMDSMLERCHDIPNPHSGNSQLHYFEMENVTIWKDLLILIGYAVITHFLSFAYLHFQFIRNKRIFVYQS